MANYYIPEAYAYRPDTRPDILGKFPLENERFEFEVDMNNYFDGKKNVFRRYPGVIPSGVYLTKVIFNKPATIAFWSDGTKTVSKCNPFDAYSKDVGMMVCYMKKVMGNQRFRDLMDFWVPDINQSNIVTLSDVRKNYGDM